MSSWKDFIREILEDRESGSKELALKAVNHLISLAELGDRVGFLEYLRNLEVSRKGFVVLENLANIVKEKTKSLDLPELISFLNKLKNSILEAQNEINSNFVKVIGEFDSFLTISKSSTVINAIKSLCKERRISVYIAESQPLGEGMITSNSLRTAGCFTTIVPDASVSNFVKIVDAVVVGADAVTVRGFYNKIGTLSLALLADFFNKPFYVLTDTLKISSQEEIEIEMIQVELDKGKVNIPLLEFVPHRLVSKYITERGVVDFREIISTSFI